MSRVLVVVIVYERNILVCILFDLKIIEGFNNDFANNEVKLKYIWSVSAG